MFDSVKNVPRDHENRRQHRHIQREKLRNQCRADIRAENNRKPCTGIDQSLPRKRRHDQRCRHRTLQERRHSQSGKKRLDPVVGTDCEEAPQFRAETARHAKAQQRYPP